MLLAAKAAHPLADPRIRMEDHIRDQLARFRPNRRRNQTQCDSLAQVS